MQLYLQNLGIDQSPSAILTPFVPRGPIREPEFSPTDLCTIKGSIGTPTKSTQTSEGTIAVNRCLTHNVVFPFIEMTCLSFKVTVLIKESFPGAA